MAGNRASKPATVADVKRLVDQAASKGAPKRNRRKNRQNNGGSTGAPVAIGTTISNRGPKQTGRPDGSIRISNTEFVADLAAGGTIQAWDLNPNSGNLFTWLARVAIGYELFRFTELVFTYTPICASSSTGVIVMAPDYDASDAAPSSKQSLTAYSGSVRGNVWNKVSCRVQPPKGWYFVGNNAGPINPGNTDIKFYDIAKFYAGLFNTTGTGTLGELSVSYVCEFAKPDFGPVASPGESVLVTSPSLATPLGSAQVAVGNVPISLFALTSGAFGMNFPIGGTFLLEFRDNVKSSGPLSNTFGIPAQADPGGYTTTPLTWTDSIVNAYVDANTAYGHISLITVNVVAGTTITFTLQATVTALSYLMIRLAGYNKIAA